MDCNNLCPLLQGSWLSPLAIVGDNIAAAILPQQSVKCGRAWQCSYLAIITTVNPRDRINSGCPSRNDQPLAICGSCIRLFRHDVTRLLGQTHTYTKQHS